MSPDFVHRDIPWENVVRLHAEIARRAEENFFSMVIGSSDSNRWSSLTDFEPQNLSGRWKLRADQIASTAFRNALQGGGLGDILVGGPCWWEARKPDGKWVSHWRPFFCRAVRLESTDDGEYRVIPQQGGWDISPLVFSLLDRSTFVPERPLGEMLNDFLESASKVHEAEGTPYSSAISDLLGRELPPFKDMFERAPRLDAGISTPSPWIVFSPPESGSFTQHLMRDYRTLMQKLSADGTNIGGLRLFDGQPTEENMNDVDILPIVPLNESQRSAVEGILRSKPVTVISGPPGCGKSQVVLGLILNAWSKGISVLFASNNNQAVDVVRERLTRFEDSFPIAIRAGAQRHNNLIQGLADVMNYMTGRKPKDATEDENQMQRRELLIKDRAQLQKFLDSKLPQEVDEAIRSALTAYSTVQATAEEIERTEKSLRDAHKDLSIDKTIDAFTKEYLMPLRSWVQSIDNVQKTIDRDDAERIRLRKQIDTLEQQRNSAAQSVGLNPSEVTSWRWLTSGDGPESFSQWGAQLDELFSQSLEDRLKQYDWKDEYNNWDTSDAAMEWATGAKDVASTIRRVIPELETKIADIENQELLVDEQRALLQESSIPVEVSVPDGVLASWKSAYASVIASEKTKCDWLPWSRLQRALRQMRKQEKAMQTCLPLSVWQDIGSIDNDEARDKLAVVVELLERWFVVNRRWDELARPREEVAAAVSALCDDCAGILAKDTIPAGFACSEWLTLADSVWDLAATADEASRQWRKKERFDSTTESIRNLVSQLNTLASGVPLREAWIQGSGLQLVDRLSKLAADPSPDNVTSVREAIYKEPLKDLLSAWHDSRTAELARSQASVDMDAVPALKQRVISWIEAKTVELPTDILLDDEDLPATDSALMSFLAKAEDSAEKWRVFCDIGRPDLEVRKNEETAWSRSKLQAAVDILPPNNERSKIEESIRRVLTDDTQPWPTEEIPVLFERFSPVQIRARIAGIDAELQNLSFDLAKRKWLGRIYGNNTIQNALEHLHSHYRRNRGRIDESASVDFKTALSAVPVWVTTAQSPQAIPMLPDIFDILVIDEATQCTVTNLLPLVYRAKRLVVIGDPDQLPAIPHLSAHAESALAEKFDVPDEVTEYLGHAENDVYHSSLKVLHHGRHDVIALNEHYRSHPLIIGFSNQHVYQARLQLRTAPSVMSDLPFGSSVFGNNVRGHCRRGQRNRSWVNEPECLAVRDLIGKLRQSEKHAHLSVGVVTPFRAQADAIEAALSSADIQNVTVGAVHRFQGDERDVMVFSPVVAEGITEGAARWVENPKNLINVAVTRARKALFVVADFALCKRLGASDGILGKLITYVETCNTLRETSAEELELFSWMMVQGWSDVDIVVHHKERDIEVDFVLSYQGRRLAVEVDGSQHEQTVTGDASRDTFLRGQGYFDVLRIPAREVRETPSSVIRKIEEKLELPIRGISHDGQGGIDDSPA